MLPREISSTYYGYYSSGHQKSNISEILPYYPGDFLSMYGTDYTSKYYSATKVRFLKKHSSPYLLTSNFCHFDFVNISASLQTIITCFSSLKLYFLSLVFCLLTDVIIGNGKWKTSFKHSPKLIHLWLFSKELPCLFLLPLFSKYFLCEILKESEA